MKEDVHVSRSTVGWYSASMRQVASSVVTIADLSRDAGGRCIAWVSEAARCKKASMSDRDGCSAADGHRTNDRCYLFLSSCEVHAYGCAGGFPRFLT